jgi:hypothetical protein
MGSTDAEAASAISTAEARHRRCKAGGRSGPRATRAAPVSEAKPPSDPAGSHRRAPTRRPRPVQSPSASVLPISTVLPQPACQHIARAEVHRRRCYSPPRGSECARLRLSPGGHDHMSERQGRRRSRHILLHQKHGAGWFKSRPPVSKQMPLPTRVTRWRRACPRQIDEAGRAGAGASRPHGSWENCAPAGLRQRCPQCAPWPSRQRAAASLELVRSRSPAGCQ